MRSLHQPNSLEERLTDCMAQRGGLRAAGAMRGVLDPRSRNHMT
jgi:hypothetical protein